MIDSIAASDAGLTYALTNSPTSATSAPTQSAASGQPIRMTPQDAGVGDLTAADWKLVSAGVGKNVGPDAQGKVPGLQPLLAYAIEMERQHGNLRNLSSGQELTVGDLKQMGANQPAAGYVDQINNAISYLEQGLQTPLGSSSGRAVNITA